MFEGCGKVNVRTDIGDENYMIIKQNVLAHFTNERERDLPKAVYDRDNAEELTVRKQQPKETKAVDYISKCS